MIGSKMINPIKQILSIKLKRKCFLMLQSDLTMKIEVKATRECFEVVYQRTAGPLGPVLKKF